jgi:phosphatidyl-myo-inositol alpha-mannosyltransferase
MRVVIVSPYAWDRPGGVQTHIKDLSVQLRGRGHETTVVAPTSDRPIAEAGLVTIGHAVGIPSNGSRAPIAFGPLAASGMRRTLTSLQPDVLHLHEPLIPSLSLLALWNARTVPTVGTFHAAAPSSVGYRLSRAVLERAARRLTLRTAVSDAARQLVTRYFPGEYLITPNGVDVARFATAEPLDLGPGRKVLFFGRLERRKGLEILIQAFTRLRDLDLTLIVGGSGPEEKTARALAQRLDVPARFLGRIDETDVPRLYKAADVYCAPGTGGESFGIVVLEAMAAGTPVVCSSLEGFRAIAGNAAAIVPAGQPGPLADAIREVLGGWGEELKRKGSARAAQFDWPRLVAGVEHVYDRALKAHASA